MSQLTDPISTGRRFVDALARQSWEELADYFGAAVRFRALIPGGLVVADDGRTAAQHLRKWFGDADRLVLLSSNVEMVRDRLHMTYRLRAHEDQWYVAEQQTYCTILDAQITTMDLLCSGFRPERGETRPSDAI